MSDRDLLERAARAAGIEVRPIEMGPLQGELQRKVVPEPAWPFSKWLPWRPLTDDGDAFRLMAAMNLNLGFDGTDQGVEVTVMAIWDGGPDAVSEVFEGNDAAPAMRRAIVRAAAAMGESDAEATDA